MRTVSKLLTLAGCLALLLGGLASPAFGQCANGSCASGAFQVGPVFGGRLFTPSRSYSVTGGGCANGQCAKLESVGTVSGARVVDSQRLADALAKMKSEGRNALTSEEFDALFDEPAGKRDFKIEKPAPKKLKNSKPISYGQTPSPMGEPMPQPADNFGVDFEKLRPGRASHNGAETPIEIARGLLETRAEKFADISGKRWVVVVGNPAQQKEVLSQFTPAMIKEMTLKTLTPEQVKERDLNYVSLADEPVITVCEPDGTLVMNKTGAQNAQYHVGNAIGQRYDPAKDPDVKPIPKPAVDPAPVSPAIPQAIPQNLLDLLKYILPLILGFFGGGFFHQQKAAKEALAKLTADQQKQLAALIEAQKAKTP